MSGTGPVTDRNSISERIRRLIITLAVPFCVLALFILFLFTFYSLRFAKISSNISTASQFNQNFTEEVDLKMYYFVTGSIDEVPLEEVETAEELARECFRAPGTGRACGLSAACSISAAT